MDYANPHALVATDWLAKHLDDPGIAVVDATWLMPGGPKTPRQVWLEGHIPGAVHFDIDAIADRSVDLPHMLPDTKAFEAAVGALGIGTDDRVVVYDSMGGAMAAARVWWTFRVFGHDNVVLLHGGFGQWTAEGRAVESGPVAPAATPYAVRGFHDKLVRSVTQLLAGSDDLVIDARAADRFAGEVAEPRPTSKVGHIPGSVNLPFPTLFDGNFFRPADQLAELVRTAGIDPTRPLVASCGSGVTAAPVAFALYLLGYGTVAIYDGSWAEWGNHPDTPVEA